MRIKDLTEALKYCKRKLARIELSISYYPIKDSVKNQF